MAKPYLVPPLVTLRDEYNAAFPHRSKAFDGWIGDRAHQKTRSDHNPDEYGRVCAIDLTAEGSTGLFLANAARAHLMNLGIRGYVIHAGRISNPSVANGTWRAYHGANAHNHHVHVSVHSSLTSTTTWGLSKRPAAPARTGRLDALTVRALQWHVGSRQDGQLGPNTVSALQVLLGRAGLLRGKADGVLGPRTARALELYVGAPRAEIPGLYPGLIRDLQTFLAKKVGEKK